MRRAPIGRRHGELVLHQPGPVAHAALVAGPLRQALSLLGDPACFVEQQHVEQDRRQPVTDIDGLDRQDRPPRFVPDRAIRVGRLRLGGRVFAGHADHRAGGEDLAQAHVPRRLE